MNLDVISYAPAEKQASCSCRWLLIFMRDVTDRTADDVTRYYRQWASS